MDQLGEVQITLRADLLRSDLVKGLVWFVNYAALNPEGVSAEQLDLHGAGMLPEDVEKFAHRWLAYSRSVDIEHDGIGRPIHTIESFFNGPDIASAAWPLNSHAVRFDASGSPEAMDGLKTGRLNSVSLDAFTFNKVVRLPVAAASATTKSADRPVDNRQVALAVAQMGYAGVKSVAELGRGMYLVEREVGLPLAVTIREGIIEATSAGGAWGEIAATLCTSGSLVASKKLVGPELGYQSGGVPKAHFSQPVDYAPWDPAVVTELLETHGIRAVAQVDDGQVFTSETVFTVALDMAAQVFAALDEASETMRGFLPHHTAKGVSYDAVVRGLVQANSLPDGVRQVAKAHLLEHFNEIVRSTTGAA